MKCSNCGNDLMVHEVRKGLARLLALLPVASYTCVRCGKTSLGPGDLYASGPARAALAVALVAVLALGGLWLLDRGGPEQSPHSIRCEVNPEAPGVAAPGGGPQAAAAVADNATAPPPAQDEAAAETPPAPAPEAKAASAATSEDTAGTVQAEANATRETARDEAAGANATAHSEPAPSLFAASAEEPPLEEIVVQAPPKPVRPSGQPRGGGASARASLTDVRTGIWNGALVVTLAVDGKPGRPSGFSLDSPPRYVVDIPGRWSYSGERALPVAQGKGKTLRLGVHDDHLRVVLDLSAAPDKASVRATDQGLVITVR